MPPPHPGVELRRLTVYCSLCRVAEAVTGMSHRKASSTTIATVTLLITVSDIRLACMCTTLVLQDDRSAMVQCLESCH